MTHDAPEMLNVWAEPGQLLRTYSTHETRWDAVEELGEAVLAFKTLGELIPVHRDTLERLKAKKDTSAVIVGRLSEPGQLSVKSFKWVKP